MFFFYDISSHLIIKKFYVEVQRQYQQQSLERKGSRESPKWECSPPTLMAWVRIPNLSSHVSWVCCWFSSLLCGFFSGSSSFLPLAKAIFFKYAAATNKISVFDSISPERVAHTSNEERFQVGIRAFFRHDCHWQSLRRSVLHTNSNSSTLWR